MRRLLQLPQPAAKIFADCLYAEANAKDRQLPGQRRVDRGRDGKILGPPGTGREHKQVVACAFKHVAGMDISDDRYAGADLTEIIRQHMDETVVVVDQQDTLARAGSVRRKRREPLWRIATQGLEQRGRLDLAFAILGGWI